MSYERYTQFLAMLDSEKNEIADDEEVARVIISPYMVENGRVAPAAYYPREQKQGIEAFVSVSRLRFTTITPENVEYIRVSEGESRYGYALLNVGFCRNNVSVGQKHWIEIRPHWSPKNPSHAGIHYLIDGKEWPPSKTLKLSKGECLPRTLMFLATMLANSCTLRSF